MVAVTTRAEKPAHRASVSVQKTWPLGQVSRADSSPPADLRFAATLAWLDRARWQGPVSVLPKLPDKPGEECPRADTR